MIHRRMATFFSTLIRFLSPVAKPERRRNYENVTYPSYEVLRSVEIWQCELRNNHRETLLKTELRAWSSPCVAA